MASFCSRNAFLCTLPSVNGTESSMFSSNSKGIVPAKPIVVPSSGDQNGSLALKVARILSPHIQFEPSKLDVIFHGKGLGQKTSCIFPRTYTLTHCDFTANLTLAVSNRINIDQEPLPIGWNKVIHLSQLWVNFFLKRHDRGHNQSFKGVSNRIFLRRWQIKVQKDDVVAEWKKVKDDISLHVHCHVSGANLLQDLAAEFRYYIFSKELPLVLQAVVHGDSVLFKECPELLDAPVWVYFHSNTRKFNRLECWGPLKNATQRTLDDVSPASERKIEERAMKFGSLVSAFHALVAFLL